MFSHLKTAFTALGRIGDWDPESRSGNPVSSPDIRRYSEGYGRQLRSRGYEEGSAVPWLEEDVFAVVDQLDKEAAAFRQEAEKLVAAGRPMAAFTPLFKSLLLDRDATGTCYLWWGLQRGKEGGALALPDFTDEHGKEVVSRLGCMLRKASGDIQVGKG